VTGTADGGAHGGRPAASAAEGCGSPHDARPPGCDIAAARRGGLDVRVASCYKKDTEDVVPVWHGMVSMITVRRKPGACLYAPRKCICPWRRAPGAFAVPGR